MLTLLLILIILVLGVINTNHILTSANLFVWRKLCDRGVSIKVPYYILKIGDGIGTWIHELCHYVYARILTVPLLLTRLRLPVVNYWTLKVVDDEEGGSKYVLDTPKDSGVVMTLSHPIGKFTSLQRIAVCIVKMSPLTIPLLMILLPIWSQLLIHWITLGGLFPSNSDIKDTIKVLRSSSVEGLEKPKQPNPLIYLDMTDSRGDL